MIATPGESSKSGAAGNVQAPLGVAGAIRDGAGRVNRAPAVLLGMLVVTLIVAMPAALTLGAMLDTHLGSSLAANQMAGGVDYLWWQEFASQAVGVGTTFTPAIIGFAAVIRNMSDLLDNKSPAMPIAGLLAAYLLIWAFLVGGILDRYARNRPTRAMFFTACGIWFFRFLRLGIMSGIVYALLFAYVHGWLFDDFYGWAIRDVAVERTGFFIRTGLYIAFGILLMACNLIFDYAKVRAVVEDRRSMIGAVVAAARFVRHHRTTTMGLYLADGAIFSVVLLVYALVAPGATGGLGAAWIGFLVGELYLLARLWVKLLFYASEIALFQSALAHAEYVAGPVPVWPESPAAEAIATLR